MGGIRDLNPKLKLLSPRQSEYSDDIREEKGLPKIDIPKLPSCRDSLNGPFTGSGVIRGRSYSATESEEKRMPRLFTGVLTQPCPTRKAASLCLRKKRDGS